MSQLSNDDNNADQTIAVTFRPESIMEKHAGMQLRMRLWDYVQATFHKRIPTGENSERWVGRNPRNTDIGGVNQSTTKSIIESIRDDKSLFESSNGGCHWLCTSITKNSNGSVTVVLTAKNKDSIFGGGHNHYRFLQAFTEGALTPSCPHYVNIELHQGLNEQEIISVIQAQENTKPQKTESFINLLGKFDFIKEELAKNNLTNVMRFSQNDKNNSGGNYTLNVSEIVVQGMWYFTRPYVSPVAPEDGGKYPTGAYSSQASLYDYYMSNADEIQREWRPLLMDYLDLREHVEASLSKQFESVLEDSLRNPGKKPLEMTDSQSRKFWDVVGKTEHQVSSPITGAYYYKVRKTLWMSAMYLLRSFVTKTQHGLELKESPQTIKAYWDDYLGKEFAKLFFKKTYRPISGRKDSLKPEAWRYERFRGVEDMFKDQEFWYEMSEEHENQLKSWELDRFKASSAFQAYQSNQASAQM